VANVVVSAVSTYNNKGLKQAKKELTAFEKQTQALGRTFRRVFALTALTAYSKKAINAFAADEKAAKSLETQLKNTGYAFSAPGVELYIANLQKATGVLDDQLRPAFQQLLTVTGSITKSQEALNTALNIAAATGRSVSEVSAAIAKGYAGQTSALTRLGVGLSKATLKTGDMDKILGELNDKFAGQAAARLDTYAGKMDQLRVASANAAEVIGKSLLDSISNISKGGTVSSLATQIEDVADSVSYLIRGVGELTKELKGLAGIKIPTPGGGSFLDFILRNAPVISSYYSAGKRAVGAASASRPAADTPAEGRILAAQRRQEARNIKEINRLRTQEIAKLKDQFDIERIGLTKALNEATDQETKLRIQGQIAILDNNEALAKKILAEMQAAEAAKKFAASFDAALSSVMALTARINAFILKEGGTLPNAGGTGKPITYETALSVARATNTRVENFLDQFTSPSVSAPSFNEMPPISDFDSTGRYVGTPFGQAGGNTMNITIDVAQSGDKFAALIAESIQVATKSGISYGVAGGL